VAKQPFQLSPEAFHGELSPNGERNDPWTPMTALEMMFGGLRAPRICFPSDLSPMFWILPVQQKGDFVVLETTTGAPVAYKAGETLVVDPAHQRNGLGVELILRAYAEAPWPDYPELQVTEAGAKTLRKAHRVSTERAYQDGKPNFERYKLI
jgi:GNAT superfamily N-acetyltransferase